MTLKETMSYFIHFDRCLSWMKTKCCKKNWEVLRGGVKKKNLKGGGLTFKRTVKLFQEKEASQEKGEKRNRGEV